MFSCQQANIYCWKVSSNVDSAWDESRHSIDDINNTPHVCKQTVFCGKLVVNTSSPIVHFRYRCGQTAKSNNFLSQWVVVVSDFYILCLLPPDVAPDFFLTQPLFKCLKTWTCVRKALKELQISGKTFLPLGQVYIHTTWG